MPIFDPFSNALLLVCCLGVILCCCKRFYVAAIHFLLLAVGLGWILWQFSAYSDIGAIVILIFGFFIPVSIKLMAFMLAMPQPYKAWRWARLGRLVYPLMVSGASVQALQHLNQDLSKVDLAVIDKLCDTLFRSNDPYDAYYMVLLKVKLQQFDWLASHFDHAYILQKPVCLSAKIRALGELGHYADMIQTLKAHQRLTQKLAGQNQKQASLFFIAAFTGHQGLWQATHVTVFRGLDADTKRFWQATFDVSVTQDYAAYQAVLNQLVTPANRNLILAVTYRQNHKPLIQPVSAADTAQLDAWAAETAAALSTENVVSPLPLLKGTLAIMLLCIGAFLAKTLFNPDDSYRDLYNWGALFYPAFAEQGHWWRLLTGTFVHDGWSHLFANMMMLFCWGLFVERKLGCKATVSLFLVTSTLGMMAQLAYYALTQGDLPVVTLGASAGVNGLLGVCLGIAWQNWVQHKQVLARYQVGLLVLVFLLQSALDSISIGVGAMAHLGGFVAGFVLYVATYVNGGRSTSLWRQGLWPQRVLVSALALLFGVGVFGAYVATYRPKPLTFNAAGTYGTILLAAHQVTPAITWYRRAALLGTAENQFDLAYWLASYQGYEQETAHWYAMAALKGHPHAATFLADKLVCGLGTPVDKAKALYWYRQGARHNGYAQTALGLFYLKGWAVKPDAAEAYYWLSLANQRKPKPVEICKNYALDTEKTLTEAKAQLSVQQRRQVEARIKNPGQTS